MIPILRAKVEQLKEASAFLLEQLNSFEKEEYKDDFVYRQFYGLVWPAMEHLRDALKDNDKGQLPMTLDYEKILRAYIRHVGECEGVTYIGGDMTETEFNELQRLDEEIQAEVEAEYARTRRDREILGGRPEASD